MVAKHQAFIENSNSPGRSTGLAMLLASLAACMTPPYSEAPIATNFPARTQKQPQSAAHWSLIATDLVAQIKPTIAGNAVHVVSVKKSSVETDFSRIFRSQVISALSSNGIRVNKEASSVAMTLEIDAQLVKFSPNRRQTREAPILTMLTAGLWVLDGIDHTRTRNFLIAEGAAAAGDWRQWYYSQYPAGSTPIGELIVTLSVSSSSQILGQRTDVYYIADVDEGLYSSTPPAPATPPTPAKMTIKGGA